MGSATDSAEMPLIGSNLGDEFDESFVLGPGMVMVMEPAIWDDGAAGYRAEVIVAVTDNGYLRTDQLLLFSLRVTDMSEQYTARNPGTMAHEFGGTIDFERMRRERRERCLAEMERHQLDSLIMRARRQRALLSGARRLWMGGGHGFGPSCVLLRNGEIYLLSTWDDGIPAEIPVDHLYALSFNPMVDGERLKQIAPLAKARRIGVDAISPLFEGLIKAAAPKASAGRRRSGDARRTADQDRRRNRMHPHRLRDRRIRTERFDRRAAPGHARSRTAGRIRAAHVGDKRHRSGGRRHVLRHAALRLRLAWCTPASVASDSSINEGDLVALSSGVLYAGYEGSVGRTWPCMGAGSEIKPAQRALFHRWSRLWESLRAAIASRKTTAPRSARHTKIPANRCRLFRSPTESAWAGSRR